MSDEEQKPVHWMGDTLETLRTFPEAARREFGFALLQAQRGGRSINATPLVCFKGASVLEVRANETGDTYRAIYTTKFGDAIYVLHAFQKKSSTASKMKQGEINLIEQRLKVLDARSREIKKQKRKREQSYGKGA